MSLPIMPFLTSSQRAAAGQGRARQLGRQAVRIHLRGDQRRPVERLGGGKAPIERGRRVDVLRKLHAKPLAEGGEIPVVEHHVGLRRVRRLLKNEASSKNCSKP